MSKYDKKLKKALAQYENGNYEEALDICEKVLIRTIITRKLLH